MKYSPHPEERRFSGASRRMATCTAVPVAILRDARKRAPQDEVRHCCTCPTGSRLQILRRRVIARIDRIGQEFFLFVGPELADVGVALDHRIDELPVLALAFANEDVADDVAE